MVGIFNFAWKILRGADVASTKMVTVGDVADQLESEKSARRQTTPKILESFIFEAPIMAMNGIPMRLRNFRL